MSELFEFPKKAFFGRVLPKTKIYEYAGANTKLKELFVRHVEQIVWKYKLAPETINVPATQVVPEIQVFGITLKTRDLKEEVLRSIDKTIPFPILYELSYGRKTRAVAAYKRPSESDSGKWVVGSYFGTEWLSDNKARRTLPIALDLGALYDELLKTLIPYPSRAGETIQAQLERAELIRSKQLELARVETVLRKEKQFNRKVEINTKIRTMKKTIETLISG